MMMIAGYFNIWILVIYYNDILVQCFPTAHHRPILGPHAPQFLPLPIAGHPPRAMPMFPPIPVVHHRPMPFYHAPLAPLVPKPAAPPRADVPPSQKLKHRAADTPYPAAFAPQAYAAPVMQPAMRMPQPQLQPAMMPMMRQPMMAPNAYPLPSNSQYDDYDKRVDEDDDYEYAKPLNMGQIGLSFGFGGGGGSEAAKDESTTKAPPGSSWTDMLSGMMGGVSKIVQADAQKEMMGNMMKMMMLSSLVDM